MKYQIQVTLQDGTPVLLERQHDIYNVAFWARRINQLAANIEPNEELRTKASVRIAKEEK